MTTEDSGTSRLGHISALKQGFSSLTQRRRQARRARLESGLERIGNRLGLNPTGATDSERVEAACSVRSTADLVRNIYYAPDMDGHAEPGEIVWITLPAELSSSGNKDRALLVVGHGIQTILGLLISSNSEHSTEANWAEIGSGPWEESGAPAWLRLDKVVEVPELAIRREGAVMPRQRFEPIATRLRNEYGWG
ncbi:type II toxin-antitoxin system PemK/MazF family toxin [Corynebacterium epidermidicanis]|uniref:PemK-like protein n=1 Tax=Corynebacterium epidermidicanis TaxID=1050174 RepID=A0A0G3GRK6_9CORY|nr:type II toxin-antitoxin system PemK/MazF family toxin [Corynebacterium epidermidicanis]AKK03754.1 PemK-like protein [Corynebacterium epidermidicanis]